MDLCYLMLESALTEVIISKCDIGLVPISLDRCWLLEMDVG